MILSCDSPLGIVVLHYWSFLMFSAICDLRLESHVNKYLQTSSLESFLKKSTIGGVTLSPDQNRVKET